MAQSELTNRMSASLAGGTLLVALASGLGAWSLARLKTAAERDAAHGVRAHAAAPSPPATPSAQSALLAFDELFAPTLQRPRPDLVVRRLREWRDALPAALAADPALAPAWDEWAAFERRCGHADAAHEAEERARHVDRDPARTRIRDANGARDPAALRALALESWDAAWPSETVRLLGAALLEQQLDDAALRLFERHLAARPDDFPVRVAAAEALRRDAPDGWPRARELLAGARALRPASKRALLDEIELLLAADELASASIDRLQSAERRAPDDAEIVAALGIVLARGRFHAEARGKLERSLALDPSLARAAAAIGGTWLEEEEHYRAIGACQRSLEIADNPDARDMLATVYLDSNADERAWKALDEAIAKWPDDAAIVDHQAASLAPRGRHAEAIAGLRRAVAMEPWNPEFMNDLAWELVNCGDPSKRLPAEGLKLSQRACSIEPRNAWWANTLGVAYYRIGDFSRAIELLEAAGDLPRGGGPFDHFFLAMAYGRIGNGAAARSHFDEGVALCDPKDEEMARAREEARTLLGLPADG